MWVGSGEGLGNCLLLRFGGSSRKPRSHHDLGLSVASLLAVSSFIVLSQQGLTVAAHSPIHSIVAECNCKGLSCGCMIVTEQHRQGS